MKKTITIFALITIVFICSGFILKPRPKALDVEVITRIETIGGHQYAIAISSTAFGYDAKTSIAMVHHEGCTTCNQKNAPTPIIPRTNRTSKPRPPIALPYPGQF